MVINDDDGIRREYTIGKRQKKQNKARNGIYILLIIK